MDQLQAVSQLYVNSDYFSASAFADSSAGQMLAAGTQIAAENATQQIDDALNELEKDKEI